MAILLFKLIFPPTSVFVVGYVSVLLISTRKALRPNSANIPSSVLSEFFAFLQMPRLKRLAGISEGHKRETQATHQVKDLEGSQDNSTEMTDYRAQVQALTLRTQELTQQRDRLAVVLQEIQSKQNALLEKHKFAALDDLKAGMAHELNNALNVVGGVIGPLSEDFDELKQQMDGGRTSLLLQEVEHLLRALSASSDRARRCAANFLEIIPKGEEKRVTAHDLYDLFIAKLDWLKISFPEVAFSYHIEKGSSVIGNLSELLLVVNNLLVNAVEASHKRPEPKIDVSITQSNGTLVIAVTDNGVGIPDELKKKIFEPFYTTKDNEEVAGLGLFAVHGLTTKMQGSIQVEDNPGDEGGTIFTVSIPASHADNKRSLLDQEIA